jgi:hypothetical protein
VFLQRTDARIKNLRNVTTSSISTRELLDMKKHDHLGLVAQAILAELAQGHSCSAEELAHALQRHGHEATLTSVCRNVDDLRDRKWVAFVQSTSEEAEWAIEDAATIASRMRGETAAPMRYTPRFVMTPLGRKNGDASHRSG